VLADPTLYRSAEACTQGEVEGECWDEVTETSVPVSSRPRNFLPLKNRVISVLLAVTY
jgi:hypothetical protein